MKQNTARVLLLSFSFSLQSLGSAVFDAETGTMIVDGTNTVRVAWENQNLSASDKAFFLADFANVFAPCASKVTIRNGYADFLRETDTPIPIGWSYDMWNYPALEGIDFPEIPIGGKTPSEPDFAAEGTNYVLTFKNPLLTRIPTIRFLANTYSNEIASATAFAELLRDGLGDMSDEEVANLRLAPAYPPGECPADLAESVRFQPGEVPYPPALMGFGILPYGPSDQETHLWGQIPVAGGRYRVTFLPIIYYQGKWWISSWFLESGEYSW